MLRAHYGYLFFFFNDTATTEIYTLSLHDALPIFRWRILAGDARAARRDSRSPALQWRTHRHRPRWASLRDDRLDGERSEEHTSELQSRQYLVCRLLLEKKKNKPHDVGTIIDCVVS